MGLTKIELPVDIGHYPEEIVQRSISDEITIGDAHANTLKVIYFLVQNGVLILKGGPNDYLRLKALYESELGIDGKSVEDYIEEIKDFSDILSRAEINEVGLVRFIGDLTADRGNDDLLTLLGLEKLDKSGVAVENIFSNHDMAFISYVESGGLFDDPNEEKLARRVDRVADNQMRSVSGLKFLLIIGALTKERFNELYTIYRSKLRLFSYAKGETDNDLVLFTHAPVGIEVISGMLKKFHHEVSESLMAELGIPADVNDIDEYIKNCSAPALMKIMDELNSIFQRQNIYEMMQEEHRALLDYLQGAPLPADIPAQFPLFRLCWNRASNTIQQSNVVNLHLVHGHDLRSPPGAVCLDNNLGKNSAGGLMHEHFREPWYFDKVNGGGNIVDAFRYGQLAQDADVSHLSLTYTVNKVADEMKLRPSKLGIFSRKGNDAVNHGATASTADTKLFQSAPAA